MGRQIVERAGLGLLTYYPANLGDVIVYQIPASQYMDSSGYLGHIFVYDGEKAVCDWWNCRADGVDGSFQMEKVSSAGWFRFTIIPALEAGTYCFNQTTGKIYFAGRNTRYYGHTNISELEDNT